MQVITKLFTPCFLALVLYSCSKPSIEDIEPPIRSHFQYALDEGIIEITNIKLVDGDSAAAETYIAKVEFDVVFKKNRSDIVKHAQRHAAATPIETFHRNEELFNLMATFGKFKANTQVHVKSDVTMKEVEDRWNVLLVSIFVQK